MIAAEVAVEGGVQIAGAVAANNVHRRSTGHVLGDGSMLNRLFTVVAVMLALCLGTAEGFAQPVRA